MDVDYTFYLGKDYKEKMSDKHTSTIVSNHVSWLDCIVFARMIAPAFAPAYFLKNAPVVGALAKAFGSLFMPRGGTREEKDKAIELIRER